MKPHPVCTFFRALGHSLRGRLRFPKTLCGRVLGMENGDTFTIFRQATIKTASHSPAGPGAVFRIRFRFKRGSPGLNRRLSLIPTPFIVGFPGFRTKLWTIDEDSGTFQGIYEWDSAQSAADYAGSLAIRMMKKRAVPDSVDQEIIPKTGVAEYLSSLM